MDSEQDHFSKASVDPEAFKYEQQKNDDQAFVQELIKHGLPVDIQNAHNESVVLSKISFDESIPEQGDAKEHIEQARQLFQLSYVKSVDYTVEEANRIVAKYPGFAFIEGIPLTHISVVWRPSGEAYLEFQTDL